MKLLQRVGQLAVGMVRERTRSARGGKPGRTGHGVVLAYAGVSNHQAKPFRMQMEWLAEHATVQSLWEWLAHVDECSDRPRLAITFDGAFDSVHRNAIPVLADLGLPATVFAVSGYLGRAPNWELPRHDAVRHEIVMTVGQLSSLRRDLFEVGSQTETHPHLDRLPPDRIRAELLNSKNDLSAALARPVRLLSIPYGAWNRRVVEVAGEAGYEVVVTRDPGLVMSESRPVVCGRVVVSPEDWMREFELKVRGAYGRRRGRARGRGPREADDRTTGTKTNRVVEPASA